MIEASLDVPPFELTGQIDLHLVGITGDFELQLVQIIHPLVLQLEQVDSRRNRAGSSPATRA
jgi:hypothetical protein